MLSDYVRKTAELSVTHQCTHDCLRNSHQQVRQGSLYACGPAPAGYWQKLSALAARYGYTLARSHLPHDMNGPGCSGFTVGYMPPEVQLDNPEVRPFHVYIQHGLTAATEFFVTCHELTHMLLRHTPQDAHDVHRVEAKRRGAAESFDEEVQAHMAAIAVAKQAGVKIRRSALCYLRDRVRGHRRAPSADDQRRALSAAQVMTGALNTTRYAQAA